MVNPSQNRTVILQDLARFLQDKRPDLASYKINVVCKSLARSCKINVICKNLAKILQDNRWSSSGEVTLLEVTENFWRLSRTAKRFKILSQNFEVTSAESRNLHYTKRTRFKMTKVTGSQLVAK